MAHVPKSCIALTRFLADKTAGPDGGPDWSQVLRLAEAHEIAPYVYKGLSRLHLADVPPHVMTRFEHAKTSNA